MSDEPERTPENILYRYFDADDRLLYVGISTSAINRLAQHRTNSSWWPQAVKVTFERFPSRDAMYDAERRAINIEHPLHNISGVYTKHVTPKPSRVRSTTTERAERAAVTRTLSYLPAAEVKATRDRIIWDFMTVHEKKNVILQRRLVGILVKRRFERLYERALSAENAAEGRIERVHNPWTRWDDQP